jgi:hypothetical protein
MTSARQKICSSVVPSYDTCISLLVLWTLLYWKMRRGERPRQLKTRRNDRLLMTKELGRGKGSCKMRDKGMYV